MPDFMEELKSLTTSMDDVEQKIKKTDEKQLKLTLDIKNHGHGNKKRIDELSSQLNTISTNVTNEIAFLENLAETYLINLSSNVSSLANSVSSASIDERIDTRIPQVLVPSLISATLSKTKSIGLWNMAWKFPYKKV